MLKEWIRNLPSTRLRQIVGDARVQGGVIWQLALDELRRRYGAAA